MVYPTVECRVKNHSKRSMKGLPRSETAPRSLWTADDRWFKIRYSLFAPNLSHAGSRTIPCPRADSTTLC